MELLTLISRNIFRHKLRSVLTIVGVAIALLSFGILRTLIDAWHMGVEASAANRLVTRNKISLIYTLPVSYKGKILQANGVAGVGHGLWYAGVYKDKKNFFPQFAISGLEYLNLFPEFVLSEQERQAFERDRNAAVAGRKVVERFGWKIGDVIPLEGTIFPGKIELVLKGIYKGARKNVDETALFFRWDYLNELIKKTMPDKADKTGWYMVLIKDPTRAAEISAEIDSMFHSSLAETLTETEKAFQAGFVAMTDAIVGAIQVISIVVIAIILIVLANTMAMTARERSSEFAVLKTLGFRPRVIFLLVAGESVAIAFLGGLLAAALAVPFGKLFAKRLEAIIPVFDVTPHTLLILVGMSLMIGLVAAIPPVARVARMGIADGLRHIG